MVLKRIGGVPVGDCVTLTDVQEAAVRLAPVIHRFPLQQSQTFSRMSNNQVFLKLENLQKTGAFKIRGAYNKVAKLSPEARGRGIFSASAGNHAQGVALAASRFGAPCTIVMPEGAPEAKITATQGYGSRVELAGATYDDAHLHAERLCREQGGTFVHAFDDLDVIAGQGTIALEIVEDLPDVDAVVVPVGGGGLIAGIAAALKALRPKTTVYGVQASGAASMALSLREGRRVTLPAVATVADGIAVKSPGELTFDHVKRFVDDVVTVSDDAILRAMYAFLERTKMLVEGAGAVGLAALFEKVLPLRQKKVVLVVSGGNVDIAKLASLHPMDRPSPVGVAKI
ncbi:threonine ammonia-lyase [Kyrpidia tusciae]|uniref:L-threonine dehydratase catabolic TdcB n=1 Tax=Kyrpidia tusciae (strain DSM 2912 / NBRC 15312 / T2) TaxID=562970 RepID=D5WPD4_KYRT2|nr:threonine ammonia-lyase [Kyrpidia tusciae]ADG06193.1 threonine dehydratase [Kyrpidia tusciae DSM 2912]MBE3553019.1 threonine ammonia-lyase [Kyrpidia tusciae]